MATSSGGYLIKYLIVSCLTEQSTCDIVLVLQFKSPLCRFAVARVWIVEVGIWD